MLVRAQQTKSFGAIKRTNYTEQANTHHLILNFCFSLCPYLFSFLIKLFFPFLLNFFNLVLAVFRLARISVFFPFFLLHSGRVLLSTETLPSQERKISHIKLCRRKLARIKCFRRYEPTCSRKHTHGHGQTDRD